MDNYLKLVIAYIKKYKSRSFAISLSIVLSIALIVGVGTLSESARKADIEKTKYEEGLYHVRYKDLSKEQLDIVNKNKDIQEVGVSSYYDSNSPDGDLMLNISRANEDYIKLCNSNVIDGKFPIKPNEVAAEEWVLKNMGIKAEVGEQITIDLYNKGKEETYKLVGILEDRVREKASGNMEIFLFLDSKTTPKIDTYVRFNEKSDINNNIKNIAKEANIKENNVRKNNMLLESLGETEEIDYKVIAISIIVSIVAGVVIYGIFNISILQRISEYGIIRAIGGSSIQVLKLLLCELLILFAVSIPVGISVGILGAKTFSSIAGGLFTEGAVEITKLVITVDVLVLSIMITLTTILIIALIAFRNIKKVEPINAIRKNVAQKISKRQIVSIAFLTKFISFEKAVSFKSIFRNKKSFYMIILSMSLGSTIFIVSSFYSHLSKVQGEKIAETSDINTDYKVSIIPSYPMGYGISNNDIKLIEGLNGVKSVKSIQMLYSRMIIDKSAISEPGYFEQLNSYPYYKELLNGVLVEDKNTSEIILKNNVYGYDDELLKESEKYLLDGNIDANKMKLEDIALVRIPHPIGPNVVDIGVGDKVKVTFRADGKSGEDYFRMEDTDGKYITKEFIVGGIIDELIDSSDYYTGKDSVDLVISSNKFKEVTGFENYKLVNIDKESDVDNKKLNNKIFNITNKINGSVLTDLTKEREDIGLLQQDKMIFIYAIIVILFVISLFNIINNVSYSLISRTNEFGMIRAMGITDREFKQMIKFEGLTYGIIASAFSVILGLIGQVILFNMLSPGLISPKFIIQWQNYLLIIVINISIGIISTYLPSRKIKDLSIVESISSIE